MNASDKFWLRALLPENSTVEQAIRNLNQSGIRISLIVNCNNQLEGTVSDGDIRRGLLKGMNLSSPITNLVNRNALVVPPEISRDTTMQLMIANKIQQIPVIDENKCVVGLYLWDELTAKPKRENLMVIMAGGAGKRLRPHTDNCPKPLLEVAGKPMLEHIIERAKLEGFVSFVLAIHYLGHMIEEYFGDGKRLGVRIDYLREDSPLGTAGALSLLNPVPTSAFVVTNGDVITDIRYGEILDFHIRHNAAATMAVGAYEWQHPFGVVQTQGVDIVGFEEKPVVRSHINAGVYVLEPKTLELLSSGSFCDMPLLFEKLKERADRTVAYPIHEPWLDIGRPDDLEKIRQM